MPPKKTSRLGRGLSSLLGAEVPANIPTPAKAKAAATAAQEQNAGPAVREIEIVREVDDKSALAMALIENMQREDLNAVEEAAGVSRLIEEFGYTHEQAAEAIGRSRSATTNLLRLLNLTEAVKQMLADGKIDMGHARALLALSGAEQIQVANEIVAKDLSVRETERLIARLTDQGEEKKSKDAKKEQSADDRILEERLAESIGAPVHVVYGKKGRGKIVIDFADLDDLDALIAKLAPEKM